MEVVPVALAVNVPRVGPAALASAAVRRVSSYFSGGIITGCASAASSFCGDERPRLTAARSAAEPPRRVALVTGQALALRRARQAA